MKIILSHDVDHLNWSEHYLKDFFVFGRIYRNFKGLIYSQINKKTFIKRSKFWGRINRIPELVEFYEKKGIKASFFFGMRNALGLNYNYLNAKQYIDLLSNNGHSVNIHGIEYKNPKLINTEINRFLDLTGMKPQGFRTHYLRWSGFTYELLNDIGYLYSSSQLGIFHPFKIGNVWEFPISIMDVRLIENAQNNLDLNYWNHKTFCQIKDAEEKGIPFFVINFHDLYFDESFIIIKNWFESLITYFIQHDYEFVSFNEAVKELNSK